MTKKKAVLAIIILSIISIIGLTWTVFVRAQVSESKGVIICDQARCPKYPVVHPELIDCYLDVKVKDNYQLLAEQSVAIGKAPVDEECDGSLEPVEWNWDDEPFTGNPAEFVRLRCTVPISAELSIGGQLWEGDLLNRYEPPGGEETYEIEDHFWFFGYLLQETPEPTPTIWHDDCPGLPDCGEPLPTLTPRPTLTPLPTLTPVPEPTSIPDPTCIPTPTCPAVDPWPTEEPRPTEEPYPTQAPWPTEEATPWPTQPPFEIGESRGSLHHPDK